MELKFRTLRADEIEARVSTVSENGCSLLLYKDARCDMNLLDETVGPLNWKRDHQLIGDLLCCTVSIWDEDKKQWISKQDVGTENYTEKEKSIFSDSYKRSCFNFGIGRELYSAPFIWIPAKEARVEEVAPKKYTTYAKFKVTSIGYDEKRRINSLAIVRVKKGKDPEELVYEFGNALYEQDKKPVKKTTKKKADPKHIPEDSSAPVLATYQQRETLYKLCESVYIDYEELLKKVGCTDKKKLTVEQHAAALKILQGGQSGS